MLIHNDSDKFQFPTMYNTLNHKIPNLYNLTQLADDIKRE